MILKELKRHVDFLVKNGHENDTVIVTTVDNSVGARAGSEVNSINPGIDWEHGQIRIEPKTKLVSYGNSRDDGMLPLVEVYESPNGRKRHVITCRRCDNLLKNDDRYCSRCGQMIIKLTI